MDFGDIIEHEVDDDQEFKPPIIKEQPQKAKVSRFKSWKYRQPTAASATISTSQPPLINQTRQLREEQQEQRPRQREQQQQPQSQPPLSEQEKIHLENVKRLASMTSEQIEKEREELINSFDPEILRSLLRRAELKEGGSGTSDLRSELSLQGPQPIAEKTTPGKEKEKDSRTAQDAADDNLQKNKKSVHFHQDDSHLDTGVHFLKPNTAVPEKEDEESFMEELRRKYYPDLEVEESKLAWMKPMDQQEEDEYSPYSESLAPSEMRFDFRGDLITPKRSREIDVSQGLHHHGDAPAAAGYTIPELAHLARSTVMSQRCIAIRTLGRIIYRVRQGKFGSEISAALSGVLDKCRVHETLLEANQSKSVAETAYAQEALWIWETFNVRGAI